MELPSGVSAPCKAVHAQADPRLALTAKKLCAASDRAEKAVHGYEHRLLLLMLLGKLIPSMQTVAGRTENSAVWTVEVTS